MKKLLILMPVLLIVLSACGNKGNGKNDENKAETPSSGTKFKNGITIKENGLKVEKAMLLKADDTQLPQDNKVDIGETIYCRLFISGWKEEKGMVSIGASEKILTSTGKTVLNEDDLFANDAGVVEKDDVQILTLKATITELTKSIHDFEVRFRVWDKYSTSDATGVFEFHLK